VDYKLRTIQKPFPISQSKINLFNMCKLKFFFRYLTDIGDHDTVWPGTLFGKTLHAILEEILKMINEGNKVELDIIRATRGMFEQKFIELRDEVKNRWKESRAYDPVKYIDDGEKYSRILASFILKFIPPTYKNLMSELEVNVPYDEILSLTGIIDMLLINNDNEYNVFDFKTTTESEKFYFVNWDFEIQSSLYEMILQKRFEQAISSFGFIVLNREERTLFLKQKLSILETADNVIIRERNLHNKINELKIFTFGERAKLGVYKCNKFDVCRWCSYKKQYCDKV